MAGMVVGQASRLSEERRFLAGGANFTGGRKCGLPHRRGCLPFSAFRAKAGGSCHQYK